MSDKEVLEKNAFMIGHGCKRANCHRIRLENVKGLECEHAGETYNADAYSETLLYIKRNQGL